MGDGRVQAAPNPVVAGVDGCRSGWVVVRFETGRAELEAEQVRDLAGVVAQARSGELAAVAVDMPIGLLDDQPRRCDQDARRFLAHRHVTVFSAPVRSVLAARSYEEACDLSRQASGRALSLQAYHLVPKIRELDAALEPGDPVIEAHPECAFARLAGGPLPSKHQPEGRRRRIDALTEELGAPFTRLLQTAKAPLVDLLDATVLSLTARRRIEGTALRFGGDVDRTGKRAEVWY